MEPVWPGPRGKTSHKRRRMPRKTDMDAKEALLRGARFAKVAPKGHKLRHDASCGQ